MLFLYVILKTYSFTLINLFIINNLSYIFLFIKYTYYNFVFIDSKNKLGNTLSKRFLICYGRNTLVKKRIKYSALMMNLLMLSTPVLISVVEVAANEQQSVNEENAHVNIEGMSTMEEIPRTSEDMDTEEGNDPMMKESENEKTKSNLKKQMKSGKGLFSEKAQVLVGMPLNH